MTRPRGSDEEKATAPTRPQSDTGPPRNLAADRIKSYKHQHGGTVGKYPKSPGYSTQGLEDFGHGKPFPPPLAAEEQYVVEFTDENDPLHPQNWPFARKLIISSILAYATFIPAFSSSIYSPTIPAISAEFHVSQEVGTLGITLFVLGLGLGPVVWAPFSELRGRQLPLIVSLLGLGVFMVAVAVAKDLQTLMICRFWAGAFGSCTFAIVPAIFADLFDTNTRGVANTVFASAVFASPNLGPFVGGFITESYLGWRWTHYLMAILAFSALPLVTFVFKETYAPVILVSKAARFRRQTGNWGIHAKQEEIEIDLKSLVEKNFKRPVVLLFTEPIILLISIYVAFVYGLLYLFLSVYPIVFQQIHGWNEGVGGLPMISLVVGMLLAGVYIVLTQPSYTRKLAANNGEAVPEWRLPPVIVGGVAFAVGLFWFGWTGWTDNIHWAAPTVAGVATGFGILCIFLPLINYLVDAYLMFAASAIAANTLMRSTAGAVFPLFATYMFNGMGVQWAMTLLGCVATVLVPIPILFLRFGARVRQRSSFAPTD